MNVTPVQSASAQNVPAPAASTPHKQRATYLAISDLTEPTEVGSVRFRGSYHGFVRTRKVAEMRDLVLVAAEQESRYLDVDFELTGIGLVPAAVSTTAAILRHRPDRVVNLGSVGSLDPNISGIVYPSAVINRDMNAKEMGLSLLDRIELGGGGPILGSGDSFVAGGAAREALAKRCQLVDMEGFAIAYACKQLGVELLMIKHVSDSADEDAKNWDTLVDLSARALAEEYARIRAC